MINYSEMQIHLLNVQEFIEEHYKCLPISRLKYIEENLLIAGGAAVFGALVAWIISYFTKKKTPDKIKQNDAKIDAMTKKIKELEQQKEVDEKKIKELSEKEPEIRTEIKTVQSIQTVTVRDEEKEKELINELSNLKNLLSEKEELINTQNQNISKLQSNADQYQGLYNLASNKITELKKELTSKNTEWTNQEVEELKEKMKKEFDSIESNLNKKIQELEKQKEQYRQDSIKAGGKSADALLWKTINDDKIKKLETELKEAKMKLATSSNLNDLNQIHHNLEWQINDLKRQSEESDKTKAQQQKNIKTLLTDNQNLKNDLKTYQDINQEQAKQINSIEFQSKELLSKILKEYCTDVTINGEVIHFDPQNFDFSIIQSAIIESIITRREKLRDYVKLVKELYKLLNNNEFDEAKINKIIEYKIDPQNLQICLNIINVFQLAMQFKTIYEVFTISVSPEASRNNYKFELKTNASAIDQLFNDSDRTYWNIIFNKKLSEIINKNLKIAVRISDIDATKMNNNQDIETKFLEWFKMKEQNIEFLASSIVDGDITLYENQDYAFDENWRAKLIKYYNRIIDENNMRLFFNNNHIITTEPNMQKYLNIIKQNTDKMKFFIKIEAYINKLFNANYEIENKYDEFNKTLIQSLEKK